MNLFALIRLVSLFPPARLAGFYVEIIACAGSHMVSPISFETFVTTNIFFTAKDWTFWKNHGQYFHTKSINETTLKKEGSRLPKFLA